jgi:hypothetical protein
MNVVALVSGCFRHNKKVREVKVLAVLEYMFHGSCRRVSMVLSLALEHISKSTVHDLARGTLSIRLTKQKKGVYNNKTKIGYRILRYVC